MPDRSTHGRRGSALLAVLWLSAGLSAIAFSVSSNVRSETDRVSTNAEGLRASYLASGAVERAMLWVLWGTSGMAYSNLDGSPRFWRPYQSRLTMAFPSGDAIVEVIPEGARLNINSATPDELYRAVFAVSGDPDRSREIAQGIADWRSAAPSPTAYDQYYFTLGPTFRARHASFQEIEELLLVRGMSPELFYGNYTTGPDGRLYARGGLRDCLSVWGSSGPFDVNASSPALMEAMGMEPAVAAAVVARRQTRPSPTRAKSPNSACSRRASACFPESRSIPCAPPPASAPPAASTPKRCAPPRRRLNCLTRAVPCSRCRSCAGTTTPGRRRLFLPTPACG